MSDHVGESTEGPKATTTSSEALEESASEVSEELRVVKFAEHNQVGIPTR